MVGVLKFEEGLEFATFDSLRKSMQTHRYQVYKFVTEQIKSWDFERSVIKVMQLRERYITSLSKSGYDYDTSLKAMACHRLIRLLTQKRSDAEIKPVQLFSPKSGTPGISESLSVDDCVNALKHVVANEQVLVAINNKCINIYESGFSISKRGKAILKSMYLFTPLDRSTSIKNGFQNSRRKKKAKGSSRVLQRFDEYNEILMIYRSLGDLYQGYHTISDAHLTFFRQVLEQLRGARTVKKINIPKSSRSLSIALQYSPSVQSSNDPNIDDEEFNSPDDKTNFPTLIGFLKLDESEEKISFRVFPRNLDALIFLCETYESTSTNLKALYAESLISSIIETLPKWDVVGKNVEVPRKEGINCVCITDNTKCDCGPKILTEIDLIVVHHELDLCVVVEVKDYSYWKGYINGEKFDSRQLNYSEAAKKMTVKQDWVSENYDFHLVEPVIVTTLPEAFSEIDDVPIIFSRYFCEFLKQRAKQKDMQEIRVSNYQYPQIGYLDCYQKAIASSEKVKKAQKDIKMEIQEIGDSLKNLDQREREITGLISTHGEEYRLVNSKLGRLYKELKDAQSGSSKGDWERMAQSTIIATTKEEINTLRLEKQRINEKRTQLSQELSSTCEESKKLSEWQYSLRGEQASLAKKYRQSYFLCNPTCE